MTKIIIDADKCPLRTLTKINKSPTFINGE